MLHQRESGLEFVEIGRPDRQEWYLTLAPTLRSGISLRQQVQQAYDQLVEKLRSESASILYERVYSDRDSWDELLPLREECLAGLEGFDGGVPAFVDGESCEGRGLSGIQVWAISGAQVDPVVENGRVCGRRFEASEGTYLMLSDVTSDPRSGREAHAEDMFRQASSLLASQGFCLKTDVLRTWIYLEDILDWYDEFNQARCTVFRDEGITEPGGFLPASTGIGFGLPGGISCAMDVLALRRRPHAALSVQRCINPLQNEAPDYGSAFTRGTEVTAGGVRTVLVSGTASIDECGLTLHQNDARRQMIRTIRNIGALLEQSRMDWNCVSQGTLFVPDRSLAETYHEVLDELDLPPCPILEVVGTVCRSDLLVEIELTATAELGET